MKLHISPKDLGRALGVSESSLKRWADEGVLPASRTAGGHRRIAIDDAVKFIRRTGLSLVDPKAIGMSALSAATRHDDPPAATRRALVDAMVDGDAARVRGLLLGAYVAGRPLAAIFDELLTPAMHEMGTLWRHGDDGIFVEHRATAICMQAVSTLGPVLPDPGRRAPLAVGAAMSGDPYAMPSLLCATTLANDGWRATNLGPDTPVQTLLIAARAVRASLVWVSVSVDRPKDRLVEELMHLADELSGIGAPLVVGGRALPTAGLAGRRNLYVGQSMGELAAFAAGLSAATPAA